MALRLRDSGVATAYATVGVGDVAPEMNSARDAASEYKGTELSDPEIIFLLGQADIATIFETANFKKIFELRYPRAESHAGVVNWVFSAPLTGGRNDTKVADEAPFRFIIHLRLRRAVYAYRGIEEKIIAKLTELLGSHFDDARIHVGLGWSDLIVEGYFSEASFRDLADFIIQVHGLRIAHGKTRARSLPVLQRLLTVFGYRGDPPAFTQNGHITFLSCKPGGYDDVMAIFKKRKEEGKPERVAILDGKADFMITSDPDPDDPHWLASQRKLGEKAHKSYLRKVETHLMFFPGIEFVDRAEAANLLIDVGDEILHEENCGCDESRETALKEIEATMMSLQHILPREQRYAIDNALFLLGAALRNSGTCCDMRDAVIACCGGLLNTLQWIGGTAKNQSAGDYHKMWLRLDDWHRNSELLLRQRIVGTYEEILGTSDRSVVYSGGVQKFLYLADQVMMDFARRIQPNDPPKFATIYDSVKTIYSVFASGRVVRIPTSQIFSFPLIVPDLWHEVAGALFFLRYQEQFRELAPEDGYNDHLASVADHYADLLVYLHGFRGDFVKFCVSLLYGWSRAYRGVPEEIKTNSRGHFLLRLYLVFEFDQFRAIRREKGPELESALAGTGSATLIARMAKVLSAQARFDEMEVAESDWQLLRQNVADSETFHQIQRQLYRPFLDTEVDSGSVDIQRFKLGEIVELDDANDLNALFGEMAYQLATTAMPERAEIAFRATAALGESAAIEYHRRQMTRRKAKGDGSA
jgi:hypothetical protein